MDKKGVIIDEKDRKILEYLMQDSSATTRIISKKTLIPITTVHKRIQKLKKTGVIKKYTVEVDHDKIGKGLAAVILITLDYDALTREGIVQRDLAKKLSTLPQVEKTFHVTGGTDMVMIARMSDTKELEDFLDKLKRKYDAIEKTQTLIVMSEC